MDKNPQKNVNCIDLVRTLGQLFTFCLKQFNFVTECLPNSINKSWKTARKKM